MFHIFRLNTTGDIKIKHIENRPKQIIFTLLNVAQKICFHPQVILILFYSTLHNLTVNHNIT